LARPAGGDSGAAARDGVRDRFKDAARLRRYKQGDVEAGRKYIASYVH
jgi:hypothetical protein